MLDDAALALEEIEPEDRTRTEVLGARVALYITAKKWDMAAAVASHLVKVEAEAILLRAQAMHPKAAMIAFNLACYAQQPDRMPTERPTLIDASC
jgi:hypothetical protein